MRVKTIVAILVPDQMPSVVIKWVLGVIFQLLSFWYLDKIADKEIYGGEELDPTFPGWKVIWIKWRLPYELADRSEEVEEPDEEPEGEFDPNDLLGGGGNGDNEPPTPPAA